MLKLESHGGISRLIFDGVDISGYVTSCTINVSACSLPEINLTLRPTIDLDIELDQGNINFKGEETIGLEELFYGSQEVID